MAADRMDKLEDMVNKFQSDAAMRCTREVEKSRAYQEGYSQGIEDLFKYIRQRRIEQING